jgi:trigger factor
MTSASEKPPLADDAEGEEQQEKLNLSIKVDSPSACQRHVTVTIPREDIERYYDKAFSELMDTAAVPGFRPGRAPRKLIETRFKKDVRDQVKGSLLMDSMTQITEDENFSAIRARLRSSGGRDSRRRAHDLRVRHRGAARVRCAGMERSEN